MERQRDILTPSQNFGLCMCTKFKYCRFLYLIFGKSIFLAKNSINTIQCHCSRKIDLTLKNNIFCENLAVKRLIKSLLFTIFIFLIIWTLDCPDYFVQCQRVQIIKVQLYNCTVHKPYIPASTQSCYDCQLLCSQFFKHCVN